jgi:hypothetical protein
MSSLSSGDVVVRWAPTSELVAVLCTLPLAAGAGFLIASSGESVVPMALAAGLLLVVLIAAFPINAALTWLLIAPLIVGIPRGDGFLVLRPNEGLLLVALAGIGLRIALYLMNEKRFLPKIRSTDVAIFLLVVTGSVVPLLLRYGRGLSMSQDDVLYAMVFIKYFLLYVVFRLSVTTADHVDRCLRAALIAGTLVAVVALLQVGNVLGVAEFLNRYYDSPFEGAVGPSTLRGSSTVASSFGLADMMAMCTALTLAWLAHKRSHYLLLLPAGLLFVGGCVAAGSFSGIIGLAVVVLVVGLLTKRLLLLIAVAIPGGLLSMVAFWPVVAARLAGFQSYEGLPHSWLGRLANLKTFFWPELFSGFNWLWGVRPAARVPAPELWRDWVYIESGHTWLLWTGGVPLLLTFAYFNWAVFRDLYRRAASDRGPVGVAATAGLASAAMIFVLTVFDPHLTVRGTADLFFPILALSIAGDINERRGALASNSPPPLPNRPREA